MREAFPIFQAHPHWIYLDSAATSQKPKSVIDAIASFYGSECATVHRAIYRRSLDATDKYNASREEVCRFLNASSIDEVIFTRGTTDAINLVAASYGKAALKAGDEILISQMEHHSNIVPWQMAAKQAGAILRWIPIDAAGKLLWEGTITPRTKIVSVCHMSNVTGCINPISEIAQAAHQAGAILVVDGAQAAVHLPIDVQALQADFYAFSGHKCYGPSGIGVLFGKKELLATMPPIQGGGDMIHLVNMEETTYAAAPLRFEAGTPPIASAIALKQALEFIKSYGPQEIMAHEAKLCSQARESLKTIDGIRFLGNTPDQGPILTFSIEGIHPLDLATLLDLRDISVRSGHLCAQPLLRAFGLESAIRASFALYNTEEEIEKFAAALISLAAVLRK